MPDAPGLATRCRPTPSHPSAGGLRRPESLENPSVSIGMEFAHMLYAPTDSPRSAPETCPKGPARGRTGAVTGGSRRNDSGTACGSPSRWGP